MKKIIAYATLVLGLALPFVPVLAGNCAIPGQQDSTCSTAIFSAAIPAPTCGANQTQTTAPVWNGSSWVGLACQAMPPPAPAYGWPTPGSYIFNYLFERIVIKANGDITLQAGSPWIAWHDIGYIGNTSHAAQFDITALYNSGWGSNYWSNVLVSTSGFTAIFRNTDGSLTYWSYPWDGGLTCTVSWCFNGL